MNEVERLTLQLERCYREELKQVDTWGTDQVLSPIYFTIRDITCKLIELVGITEATRIQAKAYQFVYETANKGNEHDTT